MKLRLSLMVVLAALMATSGCKKKETPQAPRVEQPTSGPVVEQPVAPVMTPLAPTSAPIAPTAPVAQPPVAPPRVKGSMPGGVVVQGTAVKVGMLLWGGDMATFWGNGGLETREGTIFAQYGLQLSIVDGNNFATQLASYRAGETPILRGEFGMIGKHAQKLCTESDDLCPVFFLLMTKSAGDHMVCRDQVKTVADLSGKTLAVQADGPHELFAFQIVTEDAKDKWSDVKVEWLPNITGDASPPTLFKSNPAIDCAFAITPDMLGLTGGLTATGSGAEGTVKGAHVVASTQYRRETIKDVYAVSAKYARENPDWVRSFAAAYLKSVEEVKRHANAYAASGSPEFGALLAFTTTTFALPNDEESYGLYQDASFVGHAGNVKFFDPSDPVGMTKFSEMGNDLAIALSITTERVAMRGSPIDWGHSVFSGLSSRNLTAGPKLKIEATKAELQKMSDEGIVAGNTMLSFSATFGEDETAIDLAQYNDEFDAVIRAYQSYTQAPVVIRGHVDPTVLVATIIKAGMSRGEIKQSGTIGAFTYTYNGEVLDLRKIGPWLKLLEQPGYALDASGNPLTDWVRQAEEKSRLRVEVIKQGLLEYAKSKGTPLDESRIHTEAVGVRDPLIAKARSKEEAQMNRRVEFSLVKVSLEAATTNDFEL